MTTLTTANSVFRLSVPGVFPFAQPIQGYAADDAFSTEAIAPNEALMGVDGNLSGGYVAYPTKLKFVLQADSPAVDLMDAYLNAMDSATETFICNATIAIPGLGKLFTFTKGFLTNAMKTGAAKKLSQPLSYEITFQSCQPGPIPVI